MDVENHSLPSIVINRLDGNMNKDTKKKQILRNMVSKKFHGNSGADHLYSKIVELQDNGLLPFIEIPHVLHTQEHGDLVFRIDKRKGGIRIMKRIYEWDSDKDDIDDE